MRAVSVTKRLEGEVNRWQVTARLVKDPMEFKGFTSPNGVTLFRGEVHEVMMVMAISNGQAAAHLDSVAPPRGGGPCLAGLVARLAVDLILEIDLSSLTFLAIVESLATGRDGAPPTLHRPLVLLICARIDGAFGTVDVARSQGTLAAGISCQWIARSSGVWKTCRRWAGWARSRPSQRTLWRPPPAAAHGAMDRPMRRMQFVGGDFRLGRASRCRPAPRRQLEGLLTSAGLGQRTHVVSTRENTWLSGGGGCLMSSHVEWLLVPVAAERWSLQSLPTEFDSQMTTITFTRLAWNSTRATLPPLGRRWRR